MRAVLVKEFGPPSSLVIQQVPDPVPGPGQVVLQVGAVSVNFPDIMVVAGTYQNLPPRPFSPGKEAAGRVIAVGPGVTDITIGQRVLALTEYGGYAERLAVPQQQLTSIPDGVSYPEAAAIGLAYSTAHLGLVHRARLQPGESVLVTGAGGGVGSAAVDLAAALGAHVIAHDRTPAKAEAARRLGAQFVLSSTPATLRDDVRAVTDGHGADIVLEVLGGDYLTQAIRATAWEGRVLIVGFASGGQNPIKPGHLLVKNISVLGLQSSDYRDRTPDLARSGMTEVFHLLQQHRIGAHVDTMFPLERAAEAMQYVKDGKVHGKVVLVTDLT